MRRALSLILATLLASTPPHAQEYISTPGALSDDDFYRAVSCAAPPGGDCAKPLVKWPTDRPLRISLRQIAPVYLGGRAKRADAALERAIQRVNAVDANIRLLRVDETAPAADIEIYFLDLEKGATITGTGITGVDDTRLGGASSRVFFDRNDDNTGEIKHAVIVFSTSMQKRAYESAMLEEVTQSLGLMTDIRSPHYEKTSVFSQGSNAATRLGTQDKMALRRHYPQ